MPYVKAKCGMNIIKPVLFLVLLSTMGCSAQSQVFINPSNEQKINCSSWGFGVVGTPLAIASYYDCVNRCESLGYIPIEEYRKATSTGDKIVTAPKHQTCQKPIWEENTEWVYSTQRLHVHKNLSKGTPAYSVLNDRGKEFLFNENIELCAVINQGDIAGEYTPPLKFYDWPLEVGKRWESRSVLKTPTGDIDVSTFWEVQGYGKVKVQAGVFNAYYLVGKNDNGLIKLVKVWYSPDVENAVKKISYSQSGCSIEELVEYRKGD